MIEIVSALFLIGGGFFALVAGLGLLRFSDLPSRMHAATKASGAAFALVLIAMVLRTPSIEVGIKAIVALGFAFLTLPVAAHLLGRSAVQTPPKPADGSNDADTSDS